MLKYLNKTYYFNRNGVFITLYPTHPWDGTDVPKADVPKKLFHFIL